MKQSHSTTNDVLLIQSSKAFHSQTIKIVTKLKKSTCPHNISMPLGKIQHCLSSNKTSSETTLYTIHRYKICGTELNAATRCCFLPIQGCERIMLTKNFRCYYSNRGVSGMYTNICYFLPDASGLFGLSVHQVVRDTFHIGYAWHLR